jgi:hypothetical protein
MLQDRARTQSRGSTGSNKWTVDRSETAALPWTFRIGMRPQEVMGLLNVVYSTPRLARKPPETLVCKTHRSAVERTLVQHQMRRALVARHAQSQANHAATAS